MFPYDRRPQRTIACGQRGARDASLARPNRPDERLPTFALQSDDDRNVSGNIASRDDSHAAAPFSGAKSNCLAGAASFPPCSCSGGVATPESLTAPDNPSVSSFRLAQACDFRLFFRTCVLAGSQHRRPLAIYVRICGIPRVEGVLIVIRNVTIALSIESRPVVARASSK